MAKIIILKNTTLNPIELIELGETIPVSGTGSPQLSLDLSDTSALLIRRVDNLQSLIEIGDIVVSNGTDDLKADEGYYYIANEVISDEDGFWYSNRRRFGFIINQVAHGFLPGVVLYLDDLGVALRANASLITTSATSFVVTEIIDNDNFFAAGFGASCVPDVSSLDAGLPLEVGRAYFLSIINPGNLTLILPTGNKEVVKLVAKASSTTELLIFNYPGYNNKTK